MFNDSPDFGSVNSDYVNTYSVGFVPEESENEVLVLKRNKNNLLNLNEEETSMTGNAIQIKRNLKYQELI